MLEIGEYVTVDPKEVATELTANRQAYLDLYSRVGQVYRAKVMQEYEKFRFSDEFEHVWDRRQAPGTAILVPETIGPMPKKKVQVYDTWIKRYAMEKMGVVQIPLTQFNQHVGNRFTCMDELSDFAKKLGVV